MNVIDSFKTVAEDFEYIKGQYKLSDERFQQGMKFVLAVGSGVSKADAFMQAFGETDKHLARVKANQFVRTKWVSEVLNRLVTSNHVVFTDMHYNALGKMYDLGMDDSISPKVQVEALKAFCELTKAPTSKIDAPITINIGAEMLDSLNAKLNQLAHGGKLLAKSGDIIDVEEINANNR